MFLAESEQYVLVDDHARATLLVEHDLACACKALKLVGIDLNTMNLVVRNLAQIDLVVEIVLTLDADRTGLELHVDVLGDEHHRRRVVLHQQQACSEDAVVDALAVGKDAVKKIELLGVFRADRRIVDHHAHRAAKGCGDAARDFLRA